MKIDMLDSITKNPKARTIIIQLEPTIISARFGLVLHDAETLRKKALALESSLKEIES